MSEQGPRRVEPKYTVDFKDPQIFHHEQRRGDSPADFYYPIPFREKSSGRSRLAVVVSKDERLVSDIAYVVQFGDITQTEETVRDEITKYSTRYPMASNYTGRIVCGEPSCISNKDGSCTNSNVEIEDSCAANTYCLTYEPKKE